MAKHYLKLSKILQKLLHNKRINASELARNVKLPVPTVHRLVTGKSTRPYKSSLEPIADYFSLNINQLIGDEPIPDLNENNKKSPLTNKIKTIPIISWDETENLVTINNKNNKQIASMGNISNKCFALTMNDFSMEPLFPKNTILLFDALKQPIDRSYVLVKLEGKETPVFRQLLIDVDYKYLKPLNPDLSIYKMRLLSAQDKIIASLFESRINHEAENDSLLADNL